VRFIKHPDKAAEISFLDLAAQEDVGADVKIVG
jgi:hypothetical protein